jgi:hypothetical protein
MVQPIIKLKSPLHALPIGLLVLLLVGQAAPAWTEGSFEPASNDLLQLTSGGHVLGFTANGVYVGTGSHVYRVTFVDGTTEPVADTPQAKDSSALPLQRKDLIWNTFLGGPGWDEGTPIAVDGSGNVYATGFSDAAWGTSPVRAYTGGNDAFVAKLDSSGNLIWHTFLGGGGQDQGAAIAVDDSGNVYVGGESDTTWGTSPIRVYTGDHDAFVAKLDGSDGSLTWHAFLGGSAWDTGYAVAVDSSSNIYLAGDSTGTWGTPVRAYEGGTDAFVAKLDSNGSLTWHSFLGGSSGHEFITGIAVDSSGNVYATGGCNTTWGTSPVRIYTGGGEAFVAKLNSSGNLTWHTFLGGNGWDEGYAIAVDGSGNVYATGFSNATWGSPIRVHESGLDAFVAKLGNNGSLVWHTFLGGSGVDLGQDIIVNSDGHICVAGHSNATWGVPIRAFTNPYDAFIAKLDGSGSLAWHSFLGGSGSDSGSAVAVDGSGNLYLAGGSTATWGSPIRPFAGQVDTYVARIDTGPEMDVQGNDQSIPNGDISPSVTDGTDFGTVAMGGPAITHTFTISNSGNVDLTLTGSPAITLATGTHFGVTVQPVASTVVSHSSTTFQVTFAPSSVGSFTDTVNISNNDPDENPYTFVISGTAAAVNTPPVATRNDYDANDGIPISGNVITDDTGDGVDTDPDGDPFTAVLDDGANDGMVELNIDGSFVYTAPLGFSGTDSFSYHCDDGIPGNKIVVWISVNYRPRLSSIADQSTAVNETLSLPITVSDSDTPSADLTLSAESSNIALVPSTNVTFSGSGGDRTVWITPTAEMTGTTTITITVDDGKGSSSDAFELDVSDRQEWWIFLPLVVNDYSFTPTPAWRMASTKASRR